MIAPIVIGALMAGLALAFVLAPVLLGPAAPRGAFDAARPDPTDARDDGARAINVLREIEFDRETGKLSDADYGVLKSTYTARALAELREPGQPSGSPSGAPSDDLGSAATATLPRTCPDCNARLRPDARYCSACARYASGQCPSCGGVVRRAAARYCSWCGDRLAG